MCIFLRLKTKLRFPFIYIFLQKSCIFIIQFYIFVCPYEQTYVQT